MWFWIFMTCCNLIIPLLMIGVAPASIDSDFHAVSAGTQYGCGRIVGRCNLSAAMCSSDSCDFSDGKGSERQV